MLLRPVDELDARKKIGSKIRSARGQARLTQKTVAAALGEIDPGQISRWEHGKGAPSVLQLLHIAERCNVRPETLIEDIVEPSFEQLTNGLDAEAAAIVYDLAKALEARGRPTLVPPVITATTDEKRTKATSSTA